MNEGASYEEYRSRIPLNDPVLSGRGDGGTHSQEDDGWDGTGGGFNTGSKVQ
jgi:hypothetical protein